MTKNTTRQRKTKAVAAQLGAMQLVGEIITWNARSETTHTYAEVTKALEAAGLDVGVVRELLPRHAFQRACRKLEMDRLVDAVNETADVIVFQVTRKFLEQEELKFAKETYLRLNKMSGDIQCDDKQLAKRMKERLDSATEERTTNDITKIVQKLFDANADLFPIRDQGGVYFVPIEHCGFVVRIEDFLKALGGKVDRWPVPAGTQYGDKAVQDSIAGAMDRLIQEHNIAVSAFSLHTRPDTLEATAERIKATRVKIEAYANYLQDRSAALLAEVDKVNVRLVEQVQSLAAQREAAPVKSTDGDLMFGHSIVAVIRWMGANGWTVEQAQKALHKFKIPVAVATIKTQLQSGRTGKRGGPANLAKDQIEKLEKAGGVATK